MKLNSKCCTFLKYKINNAIIKLNFKEYSHRAKSIKYNNSLILKSKTLKSNFYQFPSKSFTDNLNKDDRYFHEFESPQSQIISSERLSVRIAKYILIFSTLFVLVYKFILRKYNVLSKNDKWHFINEQYDLKLSEKASKELQKILEHYVYKKDSEESQLVLNIYKNLAEKNKFPFIPKLDNINVIHSVSIGSILFKNGDLFISDRIIDLANGSESQIAFFIAAEMASNLMDNTTKRIFYYYILKNYGKYFQLEPKNSKIRALSFGAYKLECLNFFNIFLHFYPENIVSTYYEEYEIMRIAFKLLNKAEYDLLEVLINI